MKIQAISDTHLRHHKIEVQPCDVFVHAGDFTEWGKVGEVTEFFEWFASIDALHKVITPGNHDVWCESDNGDEWCRKFCKDNNIHYLINEGVTIDGVKFWGSPITPYINDQFAWGKHREVAEAELFKHMHPNDGHEWIGKYWEMIGDCDVLITHGPPYKILDKGYHSGLNYGCEWLKKRVRELEPKLHIFGHVHAGRGKLKKFGTTYLNVAQIVETDQTETTLFEL